MYDVTIIVVTYNQEDTILETLESIRYQIDKYQIRNSIQFIVADDGSTDYTTKRIQGWIERHSSLFAKTELLFSEENRGTCKNFANACRRIEGERMISIAGDDVWSNCNIFEILLQCGPKEIVACLPLKFKSVNIVTDKKMYYSTAAGALYHEKKIRKLSRYCCPIINGAIIGKDLLDEEVLAFSEQFDLLDDQARFVKMFEKHKRFRYRYVNVPVLLYRLSEKQVTNQSSSFHARIMQDKIKLTGYVLKHEHRPWIRHAARCARLKIVNPEKYQKIWWLIAYYEYLEYFNYKRNFKKLDDLVTRILKIAAQQDMNGYLEEIKKSAEMEINLA